jgi:hypothetical protein
MEHLKRNKMKDGRIPKGSVNDIFKGAVGMSPIAKYIQIIQDK